jgi:hypothetical protein
VSALLILNSLPKTSNSFWQGADTCIKKAQYIIILRFYISIAAPCPKEIKVFGNGVNISKADVWENLSSEKFFPVVITNILYQRCSHGSIFYHWRRYTPFSSM